jgi:hypothetical protein
MAKPRSISGSGSALIDIEVSGSGPGSALRLIQARNSVNDNAMHDWQHAVLGSVPAFSDKMESKEWQMTQCFKKQGKLAKEYESEIPKAWIQSWNF